MKDARSPIILAPCGKLRDKHVSITRFSQEIDKIEKVVGFIFKSNLMLRLEQPLRTLSQSKTNHTVALAPSRDMPLSGFLWVVRNPIFVFFSGLSCILLPCLLTNGVLLAGTSISLTWFSFFIVTRLCCILRKDTYVQRGSAYSQTGDS